MGQEIISESFDGLPAVTAAEMRLLDQLAGERFGLSSEKLMENAGHAVAVEVERFLKQASQSSVLIACGRGSNGGDGLVSARILVGKGIAVTVFLCPAKKDEAYPALLGLNLERAKVARAQIVFFEEGPALPLALKKTDVVIDALLGTGSSGKPTGAVHAMIQEIVRSKKPVLAVDTPSGIHPDTGYHSGSFIVATETFSLGLPKRGLMFPHSQKNVGLLKVLDIGYPKELIAAVIGMRDFEKK